MMLPMQIQAEILTFQKLSFKSYTNLFIIFFVGFWHILDIAQHAILLFLLSLSFKHFVIYSID